MYSSVIGLQLSVSESNTPAFISFYSSLSGTNFKTVSSVHFYYPGNMVKSIIHAGSKGTVFTGDTLCLL